jgi:hypothetical protein
MLAIVPLAAFLFSYYFVNVAGFHLKIKALVWMITMQEKPPLRVKPFDCVTCLSVWICALLLLLPIEVSNIIACLFGAGFIGNKIK